MAISIALIILLGLCGDYLFRRMKLPGLVGMLLVGVIIGPYVLNLMAPEMMTVSGDFRRIALIVILLRAGFELRRESLNQVGRAALIMVLGIRILDNGERFAYRFRELRESMGICVLT